MVTHALFTHQKLLSRRQLNIWRVAREKAAHELEILRAELCLVVHELDVLFAHTLLYRCRHSHLAGTVIW